MKKVTSLVVDRVVGNQILFTGILSFVVPFLLSTHQFPLGVLVNAGLYLSVFYLKKPARMTLVFFPSIAVMTRGLIFGNFTHFLLIMTPFIWMGNLVLTMGFEKLVIFNRLFAGVLSGVVKFGLLWTSSHLLFQLNLIPKALVIAMGFNQLMTALLGMGLALFIVGIEPNS
ncbi:MAG: hypothetical protein U9Q63_00705 [Patescibacteria group bacterium]|nr:hypothetical protein [Patescibacteria group bacterium]